MRILPFAINFSSVQTFSILEESKFRILGFRNGRNRLEAARIFMFFTSQPLANLSSYSPLKRGFRLRKLNFKKKFLEFSKELFENQTETRLFFSQNRPLNRPLFKHSQWEASKESSNPSKPKSINTQICFWCGFHPKVDQAE